MKHFKSTLCIKTLCMMCATILLAGCSYFDTGETLDVGHGPGARIDLMHGNQSAEELTDYPAVVRSSSDGSVDIFSLDRPPSSAAPSDGGVQTYSPAVSAPLRAPAQGVISSDPNVQVFPLGGPVTGVAPILKPPAVPVENVTKQEISTLPSPWVI